MREVRRALLEADVALEVVRSFTDKVRAKAVGEDVVKSVTPGQMVVKIVHDELVETLGSDAEPIDLDAQPPVAIMLVGLQGSGKTTTARQDRPAPDRPRQAQSADGLARHAPPGGAGAARGAGRAGRRRHAADRRRRRRRCRSRGAPSRRRRLGGYDVVMLDTAGPHHFDEALMAEVAEMQAHRPAARDAAGRRRADRPGRREPREEPSTSGSASPASC